MTRAYLWTDSSQHRSLTASIYRCIQQLRMGLSSKMILPPFSESRQVIKLTRPGIVSQRYDRSWSVPRMWWSLAKTPPRPSECHWTGIMAQISIWPFSMDNIWFIVSIHFASPHIMIITIVQLMETPLVPFTGPIYPTALTCSGRLWRVW